MRQDRVRRAVSTGPALLLLLLVTAGLFTMHTLGHSSGHDAPLPPHVMIMAPPPMQPDMAADHGGPSQARDPTPDKPLPFGSLAVCMAVLCTVTVLALAALLHRRIPSCTAQRGELTGRVRDMVRGPPGTPVGLVVADLSVARN